MSIEEVIDFKNIDPAAESAYLEPGMYRLKVDKDNVNVVALEGKTPYLSVKFITEKGNGVTEKFYLTKNNMKRIQYLHEAWFSKRLDKTFTTYPQVGEYLKAALLSKIVLRPMVTGGKLLPDGKFYSGLPYTGFVITDENLFEEGAFDKNSEQWRKVVTIEKPNPAVANSDSAIVGIPNGYMPPVGEGSPWGIV